MKKGLKKDVEVRLDFKVFENKSKGNEKKKKKKKVRGSSFELIETRPGIVLSNISKTQKSFSSSKSHSQIEKPVSIVQSVKPSTNDIIKSLVSQFAEKSNPIFQKKKTVYSQIQGEVNDLLSIPTQQINHSPYFHSWYLNYSKKCSEKLEKSLKHNELVHTQNLNSLKSYFSSELNKYKTLKRTLESCVKKNKPYDTINSYCYSILNENLALKEEIRNFELKAGNFNYF